MGVHGLWRLIEPSGKPVPLESLENKVLAVDVSIWLHQLVKGFQDAKGAAVPHAHLLGIYHRVCKLLYFRIKPVFVFDGGVPVLKRQTIALRNQQKSKTLSEADRIHKNLLSALVKHTAISKVLSEKAKAAITASTSPSKKSKLEDDELYALPPSQSLDSTLSQSDSDSEDSGLPRYDLHSIDTESAEFKSLPADVRHEILSDLKDTRKQSSWGRIHEMPTQSDNFSTYQMKRLLKRQSVQTALEDVEKEMGGHSLSLGELEKLLKDQGVITNLKGSRIASDENTRFLLIKDIKQAMEEAKKQDLATIEESGEECDEEKNVKNKGEQEFEDDLKKAIALSLEAEPSTSKTKDSREEPSSSRGKKRLSFSFLEDADFGYSDSSEEEEAIRTKLTPAQRYMMEYSGLTPNEIAKIIASKSGMKKGSEEVKADTSSDVSSSIAKEPEERKEEADKAGSSSDVSSSIIKEPEERKKEADETGSSSDVSNNVTKDNEETDKNGSSNVCSEVIKDKIEDIVELDEDKVTTSVVNEDTVEVMSDSASSNDEDFVDVDEERQKKSTNGEIAMEVVIKPDEEIEDDLFKNVFEEVEEKTEVSSSTEDAFKKVEKGKPIEERPSGLSLKDKIEKMVQAYTKPQKEKEENKANTELTVEQLSEMRDNLRKEQTELLVERQTKERTAGNITEQMFQEAQDLLELFGVPYIIAPMEAEAQCAFLELIGLTDGTITDDSDIWLFGGKTVYKNFFNQNKVVMEFKSDNIQHHYKLTREQMILLAMLVGSDYTTGLTGVGPVTALEILATFPPKNQLISGLAEFKNWVKKGKMPAPGRTSLRSKLKNVSFTENFPNPQIVQAYLEPQVETSKESFTWGKLDVFGLVEFARQKFGWTKTKTEEILNPILRRMAESKSQKAITDFFKVEYRVDSGGMEKQMSKRVKTALDKIGKGVGLEEEEEEPKKKKKKRGGKKSEDEEIKILKATTVRSKKRVEEIHQEVQKEIEQKDRTVNLQKLHKKEVIPQKQKDKAEMLKNRIKAVETFRKSKQGPGYVKKRGKVKREPQKDASYLSEDSD